MRAQGEPGATGPPPRRPREGRHPGGRPGGAGPRRPPPPPLLREDRYCLRAGPRDRPPRARSRA
ncbi:hypothetical protein C0036_15645, partial [Streptomyces sp. DJ]